MSDEGRTERVGAWRLIRVLGAGGMGQVWLGRHEQGGMEAAIKLLPTIASRSAAVGLEREVRAVAGLNHGAVVSLLDCDLRDARPWIAMELVPGGTLTEYCGQLGWPEVRDVVRTLLGGLAHAHSKEVFHLDLKPDNVLVEARGQGLAVKLADFGLALIAREGIERSDVAGSPAYMAPEQWRGDWREFGPGTDLYALGCLVTHLVQGGPPFVATSVGELRGQHLAREPRPLRPRVAVPLDLDRWLLRLLEKRPGDRFASAAQALLALEHLGEASGPASPDAPTITRGEASETMVLDEGGVQDVGTFDFELDLTALAQPLDAPTPSVPVDWARPDPLPPVPPPGTSLWGLSSVALVGRELEQQALWSALRAAAEEGSEVRVIRGGAGVGRTALGQWLAERVRELGVARVVAIAPVAEGGSSLVEALVHWTRSEGLNGLDRVARVAEALDLPRDHPAVELCTAAMVGDAEPEVAWGRAIEELARQGPVVLWADDAHLDGAVLRLAGLLSAQRLPILVVVAVRMSDPEDRLRLYRELGSHWPAIDVQPLDSASMVQMLEHRLRLDPVLAGRVGERASGSPGVAVSMVASWVREGQLHPGERGLVLQEGVVGGLPAGDRAWWRSRVEAALGDDLELWRAAELGAVLGAVVREAELVAACAQLGARAPAELGPRFLESRLAYQERPGTWRFGAVAVREVLLQSARESSRLTLAHGAVADVLRRGAEPRRVARHLIGAGRQREALPLLLDAVRSSVDSGELRGAKEALSAWERWMKVLGESEDAPIAVRGWLLAAEVTALASDFEGSRERVERVLARCRGAERVQALSLRARAHGMLFDYSESERDNREALGLARELGERELEATALWNLSFSVRFQGDREQAEALLVEAVDRYDGVELPEAAAMAARGRASLALLRRDCLPGAALYARAAKRFREAGKPMPARTCHHLASVAFRWAEELDRAWEEAMASLAVGDGDRRPVYGMNVANIAWRLGRRELARREYRRAVVRYAGEPEPEVAIMTALVLEGAALDFDVFRRRVETLEATRSEGGHHLADLAWTFEATARDCQAAGKERRAEDLVALSAELWRAWGAPVYAERAERLLV